jgi:hypothetical protein
MEHTHVPHNPDVMQTVCEVCGIEMDMRPTEDTDEALNDACERLNDPPLQGVCKDCGNGTLNNDLNPAFELEDYPHCLACGSTHLDIL